MLTILTNMFIFITSRAKCQFTEVTFVWPFPGMLPHVYVQTRFGRLDFPTYFAGESVKPRQFVYGE